MSRRYRTRSPGSVATVLAAVLLALLGAFLGALLGTAHAVAAPASPASPAKPAPVSVAAVATPYSADLPSGPSDSSDSSGPPRAQTPPPGADTDGEAVRALAIRAPLATHGGEPHPTPLPWAATADLWYVLAAGGPPGSDTPDREPEPLVRTAPRADRAPPAPAGT